MSITLGKSDTIAIPLSLRIERTFDGRVSAIVVGWFAWFTALELIDED